LQEKILARDLERPEGIGLDATHVYFKTIFRGSFRVPRDGGAVEPSPPKWDARHARWDSAGIEPHTEIEEGASRFAISDNHVYRKEGATTSSLARSFASRGYRKAFAIDDERLYWVEPAASAVLSVPKTGGPVVYVGEAWVAVSVDIFPWKDRLYVLDIDGALTSLPKAGGRAAYHGLLSDIGSNRNGMWMTADAEGIFVVSDATSMRRVDDGAVFDGRVVFLPHPTGGTPRDANLPGLVFGSNLWFDDAEKPESLGRIEDNLWPAKELIGTGRVPLTLRVWATPEIASMRRTKLHAWLKSRFGEASRLDLTVIPPPDGGKPGHNVVLGIDVSHVPAVFAP
jgi:hypothetical protein